MVDLVAFHGGLQGADGIDLGDDHPGAEAAHGLGAALAHVAVAAHAHHLAGHHHVGGPLDAVGQRFAAAVEVVELALGDRVVDVDGGEEQSAVLEHLVEPVHAGGGLFGHAFDLFDRPVPEGGVLLELCLERRVDDGELLVGGGLVQEGRVVFGLVSPVDHERGVAAVIHDEVRPLAARELQGSQGARPVLLEGFALPGEDRGAGGGDGRCRMVLGGKDIARCPPDLRTQGLERLDEDCRLDGHMQRPGDACPCQGLRCGVLLPDRHEARHLLLGDLDLFPAELLLGHVGDLASQARVIGNLVHIHLLCSF
jgi:hypothetical protein